MKRPTHSPALLAALLLVLPAAASAAGRTLFDGTFDGWETWLGRPHESIDLPGLARDADGKYTEELGLDRDPLGVYTIVDLDGEKAIRISGQVFGALTSKEEFSDYHLALEYKWGEKIWPPRADKPRDSGLLFHCVGPHGAQNHVWMRSFEFQIWQGEVGDFFSVGGAIADTCAARPGDSPNFVYTPGSALATFGRGVARPARPVNRCNRLGDSDFERPPGSWNRLDLYVLGDRSVQVVNGHVAMALFNLRQPAPGGDAEIPVVRGRLQLQSEGAEIFYRRIVIDPIDAFPAGDVAAAALPAP